MRKLSFLFAIVAISATAFGRPCKHENINQNRSYTHPDVDYYLRDPIRYQLLMNLSKSGDDPSTHTIEPFDDCNPGQTVPYQCQVCDTCLQACYDAGYGYACCYSSSGGDQHRACCCYKQPGYCDVNPRCAITVCNICF